MWVIHEVNWLIFNVINLWTSIMDTKWSSVGWKLFELHNIASQSASFVGENVLDLAQLFIDIGRLGPCMEILIIIIHIQVVVHERTLPEFDHFQSDQKRYRDKVAENEDPGACHGGYHVCFSLFREFAVQVHLEVRVVEIFQCPSGANTCTW